MFQLVTPQHGMVSCRPVVGHASVHRRLRRTVSVDVRGVTSRVGELMSLTVTVVWMCPTETSAASAWCFCRLMTLAIYIGRHQRHTAEMFARRRRCPMVISSPWCQGLSVVDVLKRWTSRVLKTDDRLCRQRHATKPHPARSLQHTCSHHQLYQSINDNHKVDITFDARRQHDAILSLDVVLCV